MKEELMEITLLIKNMYNSKKIKIIFFIFLILLFLEDLEKENEYIFNYNNNIKKNMISL